MALCNITGLVYLPSGEPARSRTFVFVPAQGNIFPDMFGAVIPSAVWAKTDRDGFLNVTLLDGRYSVGSDAFNGAITVPDAESATFYEVLGGVGPVDPPVDVAPNFTTLPTLLGSTSLGGTITVNLGAASGSPAPVITGVLTRPGASPVAVTQGQQITVRAGDQGGSMSLTATATNAAGVDTETVSRAIPAAIPAPVFTTPLADVVMTVGDADVVTDLTQHATNATSYSVSPSGGAVTISGSTMTTSAGSMVDQDYTVTATGAGGTATDTFGVLVEAVPVPAIDSVVVIGASIMNSMFGRSLTTANSTATSLLAAEGHSLPVYGWATNGAQLADAPAHYNAARTAFPNALILSHFGGGNVTSIRPYPGGQATFEAGLAGYLAVTAGDERFYPASMTFRDYDDTTFITPANGTRPYNENILIPWIAENFPHAMAPYGRPKLDYYRRSILDFETWLLSDNIHLTSTGITQFRQWIVARIADLLEGVTPAEITERVYVAPPASAPAQVATPTVSGTGNSRTITWTAPANNGSAITDYVVRVGGAVVTDGVGTGTSYAMTGLVDGSYSVTVAAVNANGEGPQSNPATFTISSAPSAALSIINFTGETFGSEFQAPRNNVFGNAATVNPNPLPNILDVNGATTGLSMSHAYTGNPAIGATAPGRGANSNGNISGLPAYNGTLLSSNIVGASAYITTGVTMLMTISGAVPGAQYEFGMVGSRNAVDVRNTTVTIAGVATTWNTSEATPQERRVTVTAAGDGTIPIVVQPAGAALAYLGGLSIRRLAA